MANLNPEQIRRLARLGAVARLQQLRDEETAIREEFPELFGRGREKQKNVKPAGNGAVRGRRRRRRGMSAAARKAVSVRMRRYWAERRKAKESK